MDRTGSGSSPMADFGIGSVETLSFAIRELVN